MSNTVVVDLAIAKVARGVTAWQYIKPTADHQRKAWLEVGEALLVGRKLHPSNQAFGKWLTECGFDDIKATTRADVMWMAQNTSVFQSLDNEISHPTNIRMWFNEQHKEPLLVELAEIETTKVETVELDQRSAKKVAQLINRAKSKGEGSEIAQRHF